MTSPLVFPPIIIGAWQLSAGHHPVGTLDGEAAVDALERLVRLHGDAKAVAIDCADIYTGVEELIGTLRRRIGPAIRDGALPELRIHTKLVPDRSDLHKVDRPYVERIIDRSLRRLGVDRLDLVQFAWWDYEVPGYVECGLWLDELRDAGKIGQIGVTNFDAPRLAQLLAAGVPVVTQQLQYSAIDHRPEGVMTRLCQEAGVQMMCYGTLAGGLLTDTWLDASDPAPGGLDAARAMPSRSLTKYRLVVDEFGGWNALQALLRTMSGVADEIGATVAQVATAYVLSKPAVSSALIGVTRPERWASALEAAKIRLSASQSSRIRAHSVAAPGPTGPVFGLERTAGTPHAAIMKYDLNTGSEVVG